MPTDVIMPALGVAQDTGKLLRWHRSAGERVELGEPLMEIETDKVTVDVEAPASGVLAGLRAAEGDDVPVGQVVAVILAEGEAAVETAPSAGNGEARPEELVAAAPAPPVTGLEMDGRRPARRLASPKARRLARERGIDLALVQGSGMRGAIVSADVLAAAGTAVQAAPPPLVAAAMPTAAEPFQASSRWLRMAERMGESWRSAPHFVLQRDVDAARLENWREHLRRRLPDAGVTHSDLLIRIAAAALRRNPRVNASWMDEGIVLHPEVNVGLAVAIEDGLVVPVVRRADELSMVQIAAERRRLVEAAREGRLGPADVSGAGFTISNLGMRGVDRFQAILNPPQAAILAVGRIADRVVPVEGRPEVRPVLTLSVSFDHRTVDGLRGAEFLETLAELVEEPLGLLDQQARDRPAQPPAPAEPTAGVSDAANAASDSAPSTRMRRSV
jgi:pyruvate dehydrogenase E2 component (dihydrolipoamide acetyltransferase)